MIAVALVFAYNSYLRRLVVTLVAHLPRWLQGVIDLLRFAAIALVAVGIAWVIGSVLGFAGFDLRSEFGGVGSVVGSYVQRNSLLVGLFMGFAIIPLIYTVSEDALTSVPGSLRSASLGAGATPWQTAIRVVLPVAASGIFSACMIGFGRAAGETMIVLMMSGRTPIIDLNMFSGLSALSANIATELPEAAKDTSHYRLLFLSALILFAITFVVNTTAEIVRMRFRKRAYQL
jgi:phosphate transport system permease protein